MWQGLVAFDGNAAPTFALPLSEAFMRAGYAMGEQQQPDADRALLVDHFTKMYLEERAFVRHHEAQRGTATTILIGAGVTLIGVTVALWTALWKDGELQTAAFATIPAWPPKPSSINKHARGEVRR